VIKRALLGLVLLLLAVLAVLAVSLAVNTLSQSSVQLKVAPLPPMALDADGAAQSLAAAVRAQTVSGLLDPEASAAGFVALHAHLRQRYPLVHERLKLETVGRSLVFTWPGRNPALKPIAWLAHQDVVPIAPGTEGLWRQPPFEGRVEGGFVWGRGAWDNKGNLVAQLEAVEMHLKAGFVPERTLVLVFGHDEELSGREGALKVAQQFQARQTRFEYVLDEGLLVTEGILAGAPAPVALIGVAEKGYLTLRLTANATPGHSSMPPVGAANTAIGMLAAALARLEREPLPGGIRGVAERLFAAVAPEMSGMQRLALSNLWLFRPLVERQLLAAPSTTAMLRTTTSLTVFNAGNKENVLPGKAEALVNFRLLPGDTIESVTAHVKRVVADERIAVEAINTPNEASPVAPSDSVHFRAIASTVREVFPGVIVAPGLMLAATDARHFVAVADAVYRFSPVRAAGSDLARFHGTDERLSVANLAEMIRFYHRLLQRSAGPASPGQGPTP
jgi:carboxypeptidase PM20D1